MIHPRKINRAAKLRHSLASAVNKIDLWDTFAHPEKPKAMLWKLLRKGYYDLALELLQRVQQVDERDIDSTKVYVRYITESYIHIRSYRPKVHIQLLVASLKYLEPNYHELSNEIANLKKLVK